MQPANLLLTALLACAAPRASAQSYTPPAGYYAFDSLSFDLNADGLTDRLLMLEPTSAMPATKEPVFVHFHTRAVLLKGVSRGAFTVWAEGKSAMLTPDDRCPADGYQEAVAKGRFFTIRQTVCDGWLFVQQYITFAYDRRLGAVVLHKYGERYTDRTDPDRDISERVLKGAQLPRVRFEDFSEATMVALRQTL